MNTESTSNNTEHSSNQTNSEVIDNQRRQLSKLALWTPPVMMTLMLSKRASANSVVTEAQPPDAPTWSGYN